MEIDRGGGAEGPPPRWGHSSPPHASSDSHWHAAQARCWAQCERPSSPPGAVTLFILLCLIFVVFWVLTRHQSRSLARSESGPVSGAGPQACDTPLIRHVGHDVRRLRREDSIQCVGIGMLIAGAMRSGDQGWSWAWGAWRPGVGCGRGWATSGPRVPQAPDPLTPLPPTSRAQRSRWSWCPPWTRTWRGLRLCTSREWRWARSPPPGPTPSSSPATRVRSAETRGLGGLLWVMGWFR